MKIVFMGTPEFSATVLQALYEAGHEITGVYTQPDKPKGRSQSLIASPVKEYALAKGLTIYQPVKIKDKDEVDILKAIPADIFIVAAFGQILSQEILDIPRFGCVNVHGSLLPKYRGASPIQTALIQGEKQTGVTLIYMEKGIDTGDIIDQRAINIEDDDNEETMYSKLAVLGSELLIDTLPRIENGTAGRTKQDPTKVTMAPQLRKEQGLLDFQQSALSLANLVKGMNVWPGAYTYIDGKLLKVWDAAACDIPQQGSIGQTFVEGSKLFVTTADGMLELRIVQLEGKKRMPASEFMRGYHLESHKSLG